MGMQEEILENDKHIHGDVEATNVTEATTPLDDAACSASFVPSDRALLAVELVNKMRQKYQEAAQYPQDSNEFTMLMVEGKEYLNQLESLNSQSI